MKQVYIKPEILMVLIDTEQLCFVGSNQIEISDTRGNNLDAPPCRSRDWDEYEHL